MVRGLSAGLETAEQRLSELTDGRTFIHPCGMEEE